MLGSVNCTIENTLSEHGLNSSFLNCSSPERPIDTAALLPLQPALVVEVVQVAQTEPQGTLSLQVWQDSVGPGQSTEGLPGWYTEWSAIRRSGKWWEWAEKSRETWGMVDCIGYIRDSTTQEGWRVIYK